MTEYIEEILIATPKDGLAKEAKLLPSMTPEYISDRKIHWALPGMYGGSRTIDINLRDINEIKTGKKISPLWWLIGLILSISVLFLLTTTPIDSSAILAILVTIMVLSGIIGLFSLIIWIVGKVKNPIDIVTSHTKASFLAPKKTWKTYKKILELATEAVKQGKSGVDVYKHVRQSM